MKRRLPLLVIALLAVAWALRLHDLGRQELWFDEAASHFIASAPIPDILRYVTGAVFEHPPLYYLVLHGGIALFGGSEWALRFPSACFSLLLVAGVWRATRPFDRTLALVSTALAAVSAFLVTYSQEARMYALLQCLGLLATALLYRALKCGRRRDYVAYAAAMLAGVLTHYFFAFLFVAHAAMALALSERRRQALRYVALGTAALLLVLVTWIAGAAGLRQALLQMWRESLWGKSPLAIATLARDWALGGAVITDRPAWEWLPAAALVLLALLGLTYGGLPRRLRLALGLWAAVPVACAIAIPYGGLALRHVSYVAPALLALTAAGLLRLRRPLPLALGVAAIVAATVPGLATTYSLDKGQYGEAMAVVSGQARPDDVLLLGNPHQWVLAAYYDRSGLAEQYVGADRPLPALTADPARQRRLWAIEWETWALPDWPALAAQLRQATFEGRSRTYSNDVSLRLLYVAPAAAPTAAAEGVTWGADRAAAGIRTWAGSCRPGDAVLVEVAWRGVPSPTDTAVVLRLVDAAGRAWAQQTAVPLPIAAGSMVSRHALVVPGGAPPGAYAVELGVIDLASGAQLAATGDDGSAFGPWLRLTAADVARAAYPPPATGRAPRSLGPVVLHGSEQDVAGLIAGDRWSGILQLEARDPAGVGPLSLVLVGGGSEWDLGSAPPAAGALPAAEWQPGEVWRCAHEVRLPADLLPGTYRLTLRSGDARPSGLLGELLDRLPGGLSGGLSGRLLGWLGRDAALVDEFTVAARRPNTVAGTPSRPLDATFAGQVRLEGYDVERQGDGLLLRLYWQALGPTAEAEKVFVHLAEVGVGEPLAQADDWPAAVATGDWLPGERFLSVHNLPSVTLDPAKSYVLRIGLYSERTMARLPATGADTATDHVEVPLTLP